MSSVPAHDDCEVLTPQQIAARMAMPRSTVYEMIARGEFGEVVNTGSEERPRYKVPLEGYDAWRRRRTVRPLADPMPLAGGSRGSVRREVIPLRRGRA